MEKSNKSLIALCIIIGIVIGGILVFGYFKLNPTLVEKEVIVEKELINEKPLLFLYTPEWFENELNSNEIIFSIYVYNFGNVEAKNIEVTCYEFDSTGNTKINFVTKNIGNLASNSETYKEITMVANSLSKTTLDTTGNCYITNASNGIDLIRNIPEYKDKDLY